MSMTAHMRTDSRGNITIHLEGGLSFENIALFRDKLELLLKSNPGSTVTLDLYKLDFVGSSGIGFFAETIRHISQQNHRLKISNVKSEFCKIFKNCNVNLSEILVDNSDFLNYPHLRAKTIL